MVERLEGEQLVSGRRGVDNQQYPLDKLRCGEIVAAYQQAVDAGEIIADPEQQQVLQHLQRLLSALSESGETMIKPAFWQRWRLSNQVAHWRYPALPSELRSGLYIWGGVGRGKTYLMDLFYEHLPIQRKQRFHFHHFMRDVHEALRSHQGHANPLVKVAENIAKRARVLCFDECFVSDITDAMLLSGLFHALFEYGVCLVSTSNVPPDGLYKNGLQRARFLPAIDLLNQRTQVLELGGGLDHRLQKLEHTELYHWPLDARGEQGLRDAFIELAPEEIVYETRYELLGRHIPIKAWSDDVAWFEFSILCEGPRSVHDYIELAKSFHAICLSGVPQLGEQSEEAARRFIHMIDEFYDRRVKLIILAEVEIENLYSGQQLIFEFERTQSRLREMQSQAYLSSAHRC